MFDDEVVGSVHAAAADGHGVAEVRAPLVVHVECSLRRGAQVDAEFAASSERLLLAPLLHDVLRPVRLIPKVLGRKLGVDLA